MKLEDAIKSLKNLPSLQGDDEKLLEAAKKKVKAHDKEFKMGKMFPDLSEQYLARELLGKYLKDYIIETISDKNTLKQLIYFEVIQYRLQKLVNEAHKSNMAVPLKYVDTLHKNSNQIISLKQTLGITREKQGTSNAYQSIQALMKKYAIWRKENVGERTCICGHCGGVLRLMIRTDKYDVNIHPFFKGRFLTNKHLLKLYKDNIITKKDVSKILEVSTDYIDWFIDKVERKGEVVESTPDTTIVTPEDKTKVDIINTTPTGDAK